MERISTTLNSLGINSEPDLGLKSAVNRVSDSAAEHQLQSTKQILKAGSKQAMADAEALFSRANSYADVSANVQKNLQAYEAVAGALKREAVSQMMGVDLYA